MPLHIDRGTITLLDTEMVVLSIAARDMGGVSRAIPADQFTWFSSDTNVVTLEPGPDPYSRIARTPNPGSAMIEVTQPNGDHEALLIIVQATGPGEIGLSAGSPIPE